MSALPHPETYGLRIQFAIFFYLTTLNSILCLFVKFW
ncbi:hypothetical protein SAMN05421823_111121 [Catalinimonas alkaloidigena]|uniref:Uncharacterized protein n=1 Tax=Catalinimonas alkaloidigena TaxID=1075417 RepID=A0A1G9RDC7_9BACT|nr:hypothetical protein SAMN05421823_111121 [Catalinimonas alkaloidigena]